MGPAARARTTGAFGKATGIRGDDIQNAGRGRGFGCDDDVRASGHHPHLFIEASGFTLDAGPAGEPPAEPVTVSLTVTFDPSNEISVTTSGLTVDAFSLPFKTEFAYDKLDDTLVFGTDPSRLRRNPRPGP
jgi:hypothetical protein